MVLRCGVSEARVESSSSSGHLSERHTPIYRANNVLIENSAQWKVMHVSTAQHHDSERSSQCTVSEAPPTIVALRRMMPP
eukprot:3550935-Amphidinium_carterae.3